MVYIMCIYIYRSRQVVEIVYIISYVYIYSSKQVVEMVYISYVIYIYNSKQPLLIIPYVNSFPNPGRSPNLRWSAAPLGPTEDFHENCRSQHTDLNGDLHRGVWVMWWSHGCGWKMWLKDGLLHVTYLSCINIYMCPKIVWVIPVRVD